MSVLISQFSFYFCISYIILVQISFIYSTFSSTFLKLGIWRYILYVCVFTFIVSPLGEIFPLDFRGVFFSIISPLCFLFSF